MTENKRFELDWEDDEMCNVYDNSIESHISVEEVEELLNKLYDENQTLLHIIDWCLTHHREVGHIIFASRDEFFIWLKEKGVLE